MKYPRPAAAALLAGLCAAAALAGGRSQAIHDPDGREVALYENSHALLIGVSDYTGGWQDLDAIPAELDEVAAVLGEHGFTIERAMNPTGAGLIGALERFLDRHGYDLDNRLLVYYSGHGYTRDQGKKGYLVPADAPDPRTDERGFLRRAVSMSRILTMAREIEARHALFVFDSCFSGTIFKTKGLADEPAHISARTAKPVRQFITAGSAGEEVPAFSVFTPYFVRALRGEGDVNRDGYVTGVELGSFLLDKVVGGQTPQTPQFGKLRDPDLDEGDFVFRLAQGPPGAGEPREADRPGAATPRPQVAPEEFELEYWRSIRDSGDPADFEAYLRQYPGGKFAALARNRLGQLGRDAQDRGADNENRPPSATGGRPSTPTAVASGCRPRSAAGDSPGMRRLIGMVSEGTSESQRVAGFVVKECYGELDNHQVEELSLPLETGYWYTLTAGCTEDCGLRYTVYDPGRQALPVALGIAHSVEFAPAVSGRHTVALGLNRCPRDPCAYAFTAQRLPLAELERRRAEIEAARRPPPAPAVAFHGAPAYRYGQGPGGLGMTFSIAGTIQSALGRNARLTAWFGFRDGRPLQHRAGGPVAVGLDFPVTTDPYNFGHITLYMPTSGLFLPSTNFRTTHKLRVWMTLTIDGVVHATSAPSYYNLDW